MTQEGGAPIGPVRIELATSELEGGRYRAWADPGRVLTVVAVSTPEDTFDKAVEPRLRELELVDGIEAEGPGGAPPAVRALLGKLREAHGKLWRENRSLMRDVRSVELSCVTAEEDRVYFVKGAPAWACLLREGRAHPAGRPPEGEEPHSAALGRSETLSFELTSLAVRPGDTVVLFASESDLPPDLRAVENLFARTPELKRACDGLVNLLGLQAQGACAVALRFVPVGAGPGRALPNPLDDLAGEWSPEAIESEDLCTPPGAVNSERREVVSASSAAISPAGPPSSPPPAHTAGPLSGPLPATSAGPAPVSAGPAPVPSAPAPVPTAPAPVSAAPTPVPTTPPVPDEASFPGLDEACAAMEQHRGVASVEEEEVPAPSSETEEWLPVGAELHPGRDHLPTPRLNKRVWMGILGALLLVLVAIVALPRAGGGRRAADWMQQAWRGGNGASAFGSLVVAPEPAACAVFVDGRQVADETPAQIDSVSAGHRRVTLDLGPCGAWEGECNVRAGESLRVAPRLRGSVSITATDPNAMGRVWVQGREKVPVPAVIDSLPAGWNRLFYEDARIPMWDRLVLVKPGKGSRVTVPNEYRGEEGAVRVEAMQFRGNEGLVDSEGDTVAVDGRLVGTTPLDFPLAPGLHSVRVGPAGAGAYVEVLEVKAGWTRCVVAQLGGGDLPVLRHVAPGRVLVRGPILLTVVVSGASEEWGRPTVHLPNLSPGSREIPMAPLNGTEGGFVGVVSPESVPLGRELQYYFTVNGPGGLTVFSDVYRLYPEAQWAGGAGGAFTRPAGSQGTPPPPAPATPAVAPGIPPPGE